MKAGTLNLLLCCSLLLSGCFDSAARNMRRRQSYLEDHPDLEPAIRNAIFNRSIVIGMTQPQVKASWGRPQKVRKNAFSFGIYEQWIYGKWYLNFQNGVLTSRQEKKP